MKEKVSVLVVDDFDAMRKMMRKSLESLRYDNVFLASDGRQGLEVLESEEIGLIVSDWNMPGMNGLEFLQAVRDHPRFHRLPFVMVTAEADRQSVARAVVAGVSEFIVKPFSPKILKEKLERALAAKVVARHHEASAPAAATAPLARRPPREEGPPTILVVDDVPTNIDVISGLLKDEYRVRAATSGEKGLRIARADPSPDLILLDVMMPEMDGFEVCRRLKEDPATESIPVIFLTAKAEADDVSEGLELGAVDYIQKPANPVVLKARVRTHLRIRQAHDDLREQVDLMAENVRLREDVERITRHDLKNPLGAVIAGSSSLLEDEGLSVTHRQSAELIERSAYQVLSMINRSLDLYKMEQGIYQPKEQPVELLHVVNRCIAELEGLCRATRVGIRAEYRERAYRARGEELLCHSMVGNLLKNAVESSPEGGEVVARLLRDPDGILLEIHNAGVIPEAIRERFFDKYATADKEGGTGLGTYSARLMAETQHGAIDFDTSPERGTTLRVTLPAAAREERARAAAPTPERTG